MQKKQRINRSQRINKSEHTFPTTTTNTAGAIQAFNCQRCTITQRPQINSTPQYTPHSTHKNVPTTGKSILLARRRRDALLSRRSVAISRHDEQHARLHQGPPATRSESHPFTLTLGSARDSNEFYQRKLIHNNANIFSSVTDNNNGWLGDRGYAPPRGGGLIDHPLHHRDGGGFNFDLQQTLHTLNPDNLTNNNKSILTSTLSLDLVTSSSFAPSYTRRSFTTTAVTPMAMDGRSKLLLPSSSLSSSSPSPSTFQHRHYTPPDTIRFRNPFPLTPVKQRRNCWFRMSRDGHDIGYVEFHLFDEFSNNACRVFRMFCRGDTSIGRHAATYKGTYIHGIWPGNWISGGDLIGTMGRTKISAVVGGVYDIDVLAMITYRNDRPGLIVFSTDRKRFGSHFRINYDAVQWCDGIQQVFGEVVKGWDVIKEIENTRVNAKNQPLVPIMIDDCGECPY